MFQLNIQVDGQYTNLLFPTLDSLFAFIRGNRSKDFSVTFVDLGPIG